jgi:DNA-directed RNA polymerase III subunit RPC1
MHMLGPELASAKVATAANRRINMPIPAIVKPVALWTGKQVFSTLLRPYRTSAHRVSLEARSKTFDGVASTARAAQRGVKRDENPHMCPRDGYVVVRASEVLCGVLDKATLGASDKANIFLALLRDASAEFSALCMARLARLCARHIGSIGFSIGIDDVTPSAELHRLKQQLMSDGYAVMFAVLFVCLFVYQSMLCIESIFHHHPPPRTRRCRLAMD